jgi:hypothetical protein
MLPKPECDVHLPAAPVFCTPFCQQAVLAAQWTVLLHIVSTADPQESIQALDVALMHGCESCSWTTWCVAKACIVMDSCRS